MKALMNHKGIWFTIFRVLVGLGFLSHGLQKFGVFGGDSVVLASKFGIAGIVEVIVGLMVILGLYARYAAIPGAITMLVAYFWVHAPNGWFPLANKGELALLYLAAFIVLLSHEDTHWSLERKLVKN